MRIVALSVLILALCACNPSTPEQPTPTAPEPAPQAAAPAAPSMEAAPAEAPAQAAAAKEIPEGACGDQSALPEDQRVANTARWTTASEQDNFGFDVYRGDSEKGPFTKLTKEPILGAGTSDETHKYEYRDESIDPCKAYWYYVEGISTNGTREKFTPTFRAAPKHRPVGSVPDYGTQVPEQPAAE
ncbi:MAG: hypothetical protein J0H15_11445 [Xanthomonadales bacterium]|nr:hypothetical protein [Xanthomonadales bacterium]